MSDSSNKKTNLIVRPAVTPQEADIAWREYQDLKKTVVTKDDIQLIQGREFLKKSYWRKLATFFNLSVEIVEESKEIIPATLKLAEDTIYSFTARATAPNGRFAEGVGSCNVMEKGRPNTIHNTRATAETRAWNRSVSNLVGGGEVSAEEVDQHHEHEATSDNPQSQDKSTPAQIDLISKLILKKFDSLEEFEQSWGHKVEDITKDKASELITKLLQKVEVIEPQQKQLTEMDDPFEGTDLLNEEEKMDN